MKNILKVSPELVGKYLNRYGYTDINPVGKIIGTRGKSILILKEVVAGDNKTKLDFHVGGFAAHCSNQNEQSYDFTETNKTLEFRLSKQLARQYKIDDTPKKFYDFNF